MAKVRVYELAKELGIESKVVMTKLQEMGEFVRSASSTVEPPVVRRLREAMPAAPPTPAPAPVAVRGRSPGSVIRDRCVARAHRRARRQQTIGKPWG